MTSCPTWLRFRWLAVFDALEAPKLWRLHVGVPQPERCGVRHTSAIPLWPVLQLARFVGRIVWGLTPHVFEMCLPWCIAQSPEMDMFHPKEGRLCNHSIYF